MEAQIFSRRQVSNSAIWATLQQASVLGSSAVVGIVLANTIPLEDFGTFAYVTTLASIGMVVVAAGLNALALKILVGDEARQGSILSNLFIVREACALGAYVVLGAVAFLTGNQSTIPVALVALTVLFARAADVPELWFQSQARLVAVAPVRICALAGMLAVRVAVAVSGAPLIVHVLLYVIESCVVSGVLFMRFYLTRERPQISGGSVAGAVSLIGSSWLLLAGGVAAQVNSRADIILLQSLSGSEDVGLYAAAARLSELAYFLPVVFMTATFPRLLQMRRKFGPESSEYRSELQRGYDLAFWSGMAIASVVFVTGGIAIRALFGEEFEASVSVLRVHVVALPVVFMAAVLSKWMVAEGLYAFSLYRNLAGALINVVLNFLWIPMYGIQGAAWATVVSYATASYLVCWFPARLRPAAVQMSLAFIAPARLLVRSFKRSQPGRKKI